MEKEKAASNWEKKRYDYADIHFDADWPLHGEGFDTSFYWPVSAEVLVPIDDDETEDAPKIKVATALFGVCLAGNALNEGYDIIEELDAVSQDVYEFGETFYRDRKRGFGSNVRRWLENNVDMWGTYCNALLVESMWVNPEHRGNDLALRLLQQIARTFGHGCKLIVLQASPTMINDPEKRDRSPEAKRKLITFYEAIGFHRAGKSDWMVIDNENEKLGRAANVHSSSRTKKRPSK